MANEADDRKVVKDPSMPTIFADAIFTMAYSDHVTKFLLVRTDSPLDEKSQVGLVGVGQIVMPNDDFLQSFVFLERRVKDMIADGTVTQEQLENCRDSFDKEDDKP